MADDIGVVSIDDIIIDDALYPRESIDDATVARYAALMAEGVEFPPAQIDGKTYVLADGRHRMEARRFNGFDTIEVKFVTIPAGVEGALFCAGLSSRHGLPLTENDAGTVARRVFEGDPEIEVTALAKALGRPRQTVEYWLSAQIEDRRKAKEREREVRRYTARLLMAAGWTQSRVAEHFGVTQSTIAKNIHEAETGFMNIDEGILRDAVAAAPIDVSAIADEWREERIFAQFTDDERDHLKRLRSSETVVVSYRHHQRFIAYCEGAGLLERIDRRSDWGNPFELPADGDRETVIANYADHYLPYKPSLTNRLGSLRGKALACWCAPDPCHGDVLAEEAWR